MILFRPLILSKSSDTDTLVLHLVTVVHVVDGALISPSHFRIIIFERSMLRIMEWQVLDRASQLKQKPWWRSAALQYFKHSEYEL